MKEQKTYKSIMMRAIGYMILMLFLFPLGFWLLLRKLRRECGKGGRTARIVLITGCVLCGLVLLFLAGILHAGIDPMGHLMDDTELVLLAGIQGCCFLSAGILYLCRERKIRQYRTLLNHRSSCSVDEACAELKTDRTRMFIDFTLLEEEGYLEDYYISYDRQQIMRKVRNGICTLLQYMRTCRDSGRFQNHSLPGLRRLACNAKVCRAGNRHCKSERFCDQEDAVDQRSGFICTCRIFSLASLSDSDCGSLYRGAAACAVRLSAGRDPQ